MAAGAPQPPAAAAGAPMSRAEALALLGLQVRGRRSSGAAGIGGAPAPCDACAWRHQAHPALRQTHFSD